MPLARSKLGLSLYAIGSNRLAAFRSGVAGRPDEGRAYALTGLFAALGGLSLTASTGIGTPVPGPYTLLSVAAVVLGGVSLAGGRGGLFGPVIAVVVLQLIRTDLTFLNVDTNLAPGRAGDHPDRGRHVRQLVSQMRRSAPMSASVRATRRPRPAALAHDAARPADRSRSSGCWPSSSWSSQSCSPGIVGLPLGRA